MKKITRVLAVVMTALLLSGCFGRHSIKIISGKDYLESCPSGAKAGETVTVNTVSVTDADLYVNAADDTEITQVSDGVFEFVMPDHDVELKITVISNNGA